MMRLGHCWISEFFSGLLTFVSVRAPGALTEKNVYHIAFGVWQGTPPALTRKRVPAGKGLLPKYFPVKLSSGFLQEFLVRAPVKSLSSYAGKHSSWWPLIPVAKPWRVPNPPGANPLVAERAFPTSDDWSLRGCQVCRRNDTGICRDFQ